MNNIDTQMQKRYWLVTILIETDEGTCDDHALYAREEDARQRMDSEVADMARRFCMDEGCTLVSLPNIVQWSDSDGRGFTIGYYDVPLM